MSEETKQPEEQQPEAQAPKRRNAAKKQPEHGIKNMRSGDVNIAGMLFMKPGQVVELSAEQKKNTRLMKRVKRGIETGMLAEV